LSIRWESDVSVCPGLSTFSRSLSHELDLPAGASQKPRLPKRSQILALTRTQLIPVSTNTDSSGEVGHALISVGSSTAK
jgi:hypothetical protein